MISLGNGLKLGGRSYGSSNLLQKTEAFDNAYWSKTDLTVTANAIAAPNGTTTADLLTAGVAGTDFVGVNVTTSPLLQHTLSAYAKRGNADWLLLSMSGAGTERLRGWFNLNTGAAGSAANVAPATGATVGIQDMGGGWYRCWLTGILGGVGSTITPLSWCAPADANAGRVSNSTRYQWGMQLQLGSLGPYRPVA